MTLRSRSLFILAGLTLFLTVRPASAVLILELDPTNFTIRFLGSDSGTPTTSGVFDGRTDWSAPFTLSDSSVSSVLIDSAISSSAGPPLSLNSFLVRRGNVSEPSFEINIITGNSNAQTISGTGVAVTYSNWTPNQKSDLESFVLGGGSFDIINGIGFESILTQVVPEPGTVTLVLAAITLGGLYLLRRCRAAR